MSSFGNAAQVQVRDADGTRRWVSFEDFSAISKERKKRIRQQNLDRYQSKWVGVRPPERIVWPWFVAAMATSLTSWLLLSVAEHSGPFGVCAGFLAFASILLGSFWFAELTAKHGFYL